MVFINKLLDQNGLLLAGFSGRHFLNSDNEKLRYSFKTREGMDRVKDNVQLLKNYLAFENAKFVMAKQIHSAKILEINKSILSSDSITEYEGDAILTASKNMLLGVITADCIPILIYEKTSGLIATVHAGWKETSQKILFKVLEKIKGYSTDCAFKIFIGPHIKAQCYEIKEDLFEYFSEYRNFIYKKGDRFFLDLTAINLAQIKETGINPEKIEISRFDLCTHCENESFFSYRKEGINAGCNLGFIGISDGRIN